ncbi:aspartyl-tRNA synthetase, mitochondrial isoform X2 [Arctopsyche grandis]|uniref:aspartyl-tRNA synthetase, mitochondrial isoform X2 n=1 Tax=Arctopsyche grandis TaxID=121162 RepID=UPI00406D7330
MTMWRAAARVADGFPIRRPFRSFPNPGYPMEPFETMPRRVSCGELRTQHIGALVELAGSVQEKRLGRFLLLRDAHGTTQLVIPDETMVTGQVEVSIQEVVMVRVNRGNFIKNDKNIRGKMINSQTASVRNYTTSAYAKSLTTEEYTKCKGSESLILQMQNRAETCGDFSSDDVGRKVTLIGWIHGQHLPRFIKLKDGHGIIQCLIPIVKPELQNVLKTITSEDVLQVVGTVMARPTSQVNMQEGGGDIEILVNEIIKLDPNLPVPILDEEIDEPKPNETGINSHTWRTHTCGELNIEHVGQQITLCGWLEHCRLGKFFTIRDSYGVTQCIISDENVQAYSIHNIPLESTLEVKGHVGARPASSINPNMDTGEIEVLINSLKVLNPATFAPFQIRSFNKPKEQLHLRHRYLYLRYPEMQSNLRTRSNILMKMRKFLVDTHEFVEVETPTLFCRTPGGAKEFIVPTRHKGQFYSLIQSPQQHKQMLMAGAIDRYFQVARCYRDEATRIDRQPEFTQMDIEMSFASRENIMSLVEDLVRCSWPHPLPSPFPCFTYQEILSKYGTDKPDTSYDLLLQNITNHLNTNGNLSSNVEDFGAFAIVVRQKMNINISNNFKKSLQESAIERFPNVRLICSRIKQPLDQWCTSIAILGKDVMQVIAAELELSIGETLFIAYGPKDKVCWCLGEIRSKLGEQAKTNNQLEQTSSAETPMWVIDFPLFNKGDDNQLETCHHPFTAPHPDDFHLLKTNPLKVRSLAYDLVLAGNEIAGGSVRIHNSQLQREVLEMLKISPEPLEHLLKALESGCPPHAGIALGIDRLVAIACGAESIREVIAFPKSHEGRDPLSGAPSHLTQKDLDVYNICVPDSIDPAPKRLRTDV